MKSGFVSLIGRPNAGKSTLINSIVGSKIAIVSSKPQTTRNIIQGIYNDSEAQIVFVDTPGIHKPINKLGKILNKESLSLIKDVDVILLLVDGSEFFGNQEKYILEVLKNTEIPVVLVINKVDLLSKEELIKKIEEYKDLFPFANIVPISALQNNNIRTLLNVIKSYLTDEVKYFDYNVKTTNSKKFMISELVREKVLDMTEKEVPHSVTCVTTNIEDKKNIANIAVDIIVERDSLKKIIIGKKGNMLKAIGTEARKDMEEYLGKQVYLELYVKTIRNWRDKDKRLQEFGFNDFE
ncbi:MAG TPA: GTPase Era [Bacilli bacterium]|nr:GTPase Era [Bacilli bacterium]